MVSSHQQGESGTQQHAATAGKPDSKSSGKQSAPNSAKQASQLAVVLVRGYVNITKKVIDTLRLLGLTTKNRCVIVDNNAVNRGMLRKVKDLVTWGEVTDETVSQLIAQRGQLYLGRLTDAKGLYHYRYFTVNGKHYKKYFSLNPPRKGFGRKGIKVGYNAGGALGYRREKINDLLLRMI